MQSFLLCCLQCFCARLFVNTCSTFNIIIYNKQNYLNMHFSKANRIFNIPLGHQCSRTCGRRPGAWGTGRLAYVLEGWRGAGCVAGLHTARCRRRCMDEGCGAPASGLSLASESGPKGSPGTGRGTEKEEAKFSQCLTTHLLHRSQELLDSPSKFL